MNGQTSTNPWVLWAVGFGVGVIAALIGVIYAVIQRRADKLEARTDEQETIFARHLENNALVVERMRAAETEIAYLKAEVSVLRERWHAQQNETTRALASWYTGIVDQIHDQIEKRIRAFPSIDRRQDR